MLDELTKSPTSHQSTLPSAILLVLNVLAAVAVLNVFSGPLCDFLESLPCRLESPRGLTLPCRLHLSCSQSVSLRSWPKSFYGIATLFLRPSLKIFVSPFLAQEMAISLGLPVIDRRKSKHSSSSPVNSKKLVSRVLTISIPLAQSIESTVHICLRIARVMQHGTEYLSKLVFGGSSAQSPYIQRNAALTPLPRQWANTPSTAFRATQQLPYKRVLVWNLVPIGCTVTSKLSAE